MREIIDTDGNIKFMCLIICGIKYGNKDYVMYSVKRDESYDNIFISKLVTNSQGYVMDNNFAGGEKEAFDNVVKAILDKDSEQNLKEKGITLIKNLELVGINKFSVTGCYITTFKRNLIKECMNYYKLIDDNKKNVIVKEGEISYFSKNNLLYIGLILLGVLVIIFCLIMILISFDIL